MAALNLYRYAELFRSKDVKGVDLLSLDKDKLMVRSLDGLLSMYGSFVIHNSPPTYYHKKERSNERETAGARAKKEKKGKKKTLTT